MLNNDDDEAVHRLTWLALYWTYEPARVTQERVECKHNLALSVTKTSLAAPCKAVAGDAKNKPSNSSMPCKLAFSTICGEQERLCD
jgi:hypothetical protein